MYDILAESKRFATKATLQEVNLDDQIRLVKSVCHSSEQPWSLIQAIKQQYEQDVLHQLNELLVKKVQISIEPCMEFDDNGQSYNNLSSFGFIFENHAIWIPINDEDEEYCFIQSVLESDPEYEEQREALVKAGFDLTNDKALERLISLVTDYWEIKECESVLSFPLNAPHVQG